MAYGTRWMLPKWNRFLACVTFTDDLFHTLYDFRCCWTKSCAKKTCKAAKSWGLTSLMRWTTPCKSWNPGIRQFWDCLGETAIRIYIPTSAVSEIDGYWCKSKHTHGSNYQDIGHDHWRKSKATGHNVQKRLCIRSGVSLLKKYLEGARFIIWTDCNTSRWTRSIVDATGSLTQWWLRLP